MLLDLKPREIALPGGVTLVARPLEAWAYLRWLGHAAERWPVAGGTTEPEAGSAGPGAEGSAEAKTTPPRRAFADPEAHRIAGEIVSAHALRIEGLEIDDAAGRRAGTVQDLVTHGALAGHVLRAMHALLAASVLKEADSGNFVAPPQPGSPGHITP
jgi:hypothetical protein